MTPGERAQALHGTLTQHLVSSGGGPSSLPGRGTQAWPCHCPLTERLAVPPEASSSPGADGAWLWLFAVEDAL